MFVATARKLRKSMTRQEVKLWIRLRELRRNGYHFRRQAPLKNYVLDFVCYRYRLAIEVDGGQHSFNEIVRRDSRRDGFLQSQGFQVLQFWNSDVDTNLDGVVETILTALAARPHPAAFGGHPPHKGEG
jgi:very-short-patch-repair endonuclease